MSEKTNSISFFHGFLKFGKCMFIWSIFITLLFLNSCIEPYFAEIDEEPTLISIEGSIIKGASQQKVVISRTTSLLNPKLNPVLGCDVRAIDNLSNEYPFDEIKNGIYLADIPEEDLVAGRQYMLRILTSEGELYESDFETLHDGVEIDSFYYETEDRVDTYTGNEYSGIQFYLDLKASDDASRYFRWRVEETWEYESFAPISFYYLDKSLTPYPPEDIWAVYRCWTTQDISKIYLSNTINLTTNEKKKIQLNYVSDQTEQLRVKYSAIVSQYALSENAYNYFEQNMIATQESDGLYTRQPSQPLTNICNVDNCDERVLGYFWVSTRSYKRIFVPPINGMNVNREFCVVEEFNIEDHGDGPFPLYIYDDKDGGKRMTSSLYCFDCTQRGGTNVRPTFWE